MKPFSVSVSQDPEGIPVPWSIWKSFKHPNTYLEPGTCQFVLYSLPWPLPKKIQTPIKTGVIWLPGRNSTWKCALDTPKPKGFKGILFAKSTCSDILSIYEPTRILCFSLVDSMVSHLSTVFHRRWFPAWSSSTFQAPIRATPTKSSSAKTRWLTIGILKRIIPVSTPWSEYMAQSPKGGLIGLILAL